MYYSFHHRLHQLIESVPFTVESPKSKRFLCQFIFHLPDGDKKLSIRADNCGPYLQWIPDKYLKGV